MAFTRGKLSKVVLFDGTTEHAIQEAQEMRVSFAAGEEDITPFGADWEDMIQTTRSCTVSFSGGYDPSDASGWAKLKDAFLSGQKLTESGVFNHVDARLRAYINATHYFALDGHVALSLQAAPKGVLKADVTFKSAGAVAFV
jgi:hypothetical protein